MTAGSLLDALPPELPDDLRAFLECRADRATLANGPVTWVRIPPGARGLVGEGPPVLEILPGSTSTSATLRLSLGWVKVALPITVPELPTGLYEAVVDCPGCESLAAGATTFPAGSLAVVGADEEGGAGPRPNGIVLGVLFVVLTGLAILAWRKGWYRPFSVRRRPT